MSPNARDRGAVVVATADESAWISLLPLLSVSHTPKRAVTIKECATHLAAGSVSVILADREFPDGTWRELVNLAVSTSPGSCVVVLDRGADESLWLDILDAGAFDLLQSPVEPLSLRRTIESAELQWRAAAAAAAA